MSDSVPRKADQVAQQILGRIVHGELEVGAILPKESDLAVEFGVNRGVVREANKLLEVHGLLKPIRRRGTVVLDPMESVSPDVLKAMLIGPDGTIDGDVLAEFLEIRTELDQLMCGLAAERRTQEDIAHIEALLSEAEGVLDDPEQYGKLIDGLGLRLARAAHNRIFLMLAHWHRRVRHDFDELFVTVRINTDAHLMGTRMLLEAIKSGDRDLAESVVRNFHEWANAHLLAMAEKKS